MPFISPTTTNSLRYISDVTCGEKGRTCCDKSIDTVTKKSIDILIKKSIDIVTKESIDIIVGNTNRLTPRSQLEAHSSVIRTNSQSSPWQAILRMLLIFCLITNAVAKPSIVNMKLNRLKRDGQQSDGDESNNVNVNNVPTSATDDEAQSDAVAANGIKNWLVHDDDRHDDAAADEEYYEEDDRVMSAETPTRHDEINLKLRRGAKALHKFQHQLQQQMLNSAPAAAAGKTASGGADDLARISISATVTTNDAAKTSRNGRDRPGGAAAHRARHTESKRWKHPHDLSRYGSKDSKQLARIQQNNGGAAGGPLEQGGGSSGRKFSEFSSGRKLSSPYECPRVNGKVTQLLCPSRRRHGYHVCIDETALCNGRNECPNGEDENPVNCMFYKTTMRYFKTVVDQVVELSEHVLEQSRRRSQDEL